MSVDNKGLTIEDHDGPMPCGHPRSCHYIIVEEPDAPQDCCTRCEEEAGLWP